MLIAQQKRKENIAEYLLYLWQVEDLLRACKLDIDTVDKAVISRYEVDDATRHEIKEWYESLIKMMELENVRDQGHLRICHNVLIRLNDLHQQLLGDQNRFPDYHADYYRTLPYIVQLRATMPENERPGELETCFNALYGVMMLHLQGKEITQDTAAAISQISHFIGMLAAYYKRDEEKPLFNDNQIEQ
jgi:hypothetical protein